MSAYLAIFRAALLALLRYRVAALAGLLTQGFWGVLRVSIFLACYASVPQNLRLPLSREQVIDYVWLGQAFFALLPARLDPTVAAMMKDGTIAYELSRPLDLYGWWYVRNVALRLAPALLRAPPLLLFSLLLPSPWGLHLPRDLWAAGYFALGLVSALALTATLGALMSVITIATVNGDGVARLFGMSSWLCSGILLPLALLPPSVRWLLEALPFAGIFDTPLRLYVGSLTGGAALLAFARQWLWSLALIVFGRILMARTLRRMVIQGG